MKVMFSYLVCFLCCIVPYKNEYEMLLQILILKLRFGLFATLVLRCFTPQ